MDLFLHNHYLGVIGFLIAANLITLLNALLLRRLDRYEKLASTPRVEVLIPARNEESNLEACLRSLLAQDYPNYVIRVLDDHSNDRTAEIITRLAREDARILPLTGLDLPEDWMGKHWACWQLAHAGMQDGKAGEWLLFTDADTLYHPSAISNAVSAVQQEKIDLLCALPRELVISLGEKLMVPYFLFATFAFVPLFLGRWFASSPTSFAIGQFLFFRRETYLAVGGHAAVRQDVVDDLALVRLTVKSQWRMLLVDGQKRVICRMYHSLGEAWLGFSKNMFAAFGYNVPLYLFIWVWTAIVFLQPLIFITGLWDAIPQDLNLLNLLLVVSLWTMVYLRLNFPVSMVLLYPVTFLLSLAVAIRSFFLNIRGQSEWKGRRLIKPHIRWIG